MRGDCTQYDGDLAISIANLTTLKYHLNSVVSTPVERYATIDIKYLYLEILIQVYEYMRVPLGAITIENNQVLQLD